MNKRKFMSRLVVSMLATTMLLTGCGGSKTEQASGEKVDTPASTEKKEEATGKGKDAGPVELSFYMMNGPVNDFDRVMGKANEIIEEEINAKLNLVCVDSGTYADKMNLMINSGDDFDLCFTASWGGVNFFENAAKGAYADLTDLMPQYAPETYARIPEGLWDGVKVNGRIYATVNYQQWGVAARKGFVYREDLANEVGFDWKATKDKPTLEVMKMLDPFFSESLKNHPDMIGWETSSTYSFFANEPLMWDMECVGDMTSPGWVRFEEPTKVINQFETPEFAEYCKIMREWYQKGYVRKDGATVKDVNPDRKAGKIMAQWNYAWPDMIDSPFPEGMEPVGAMSMTTRDYAPAVSVTTTRTVIPANAASTAAVAISAHSKNIEKSLELIELINTNDELFNLISGGEEGTDYLYDEKGMFVQPEGKYNFNWNEWQIGQSYSPDFERSITLNKNAQGDYQKQNMEIVFEADKKADVSPVTGFNFDPTPIKTQLANCSAVIVEMIPSLSNGCLDPDKALPEFLQRLKTAGVDDIIAEKQAQLDAWRANQ